MRSPSAKAELRSVKRGESGCGVCAHAIAVAEMNRAITLRMFCYYTAHRNMCSTKRPGAPGLFVFARMSGGRGCDVVQIADRKAGQTTKLSPLQSRENRGERALSPLPVQIAGAHAAAA